MGVFGSHFWAIQGKFQSIWRPKKQVIKFILKLISPLFLAKNDPNTPKIMYCCTGLMYCCTGLQHTVLGGALRGRSGGDYGHFRAIQRPNSKILAIIGTISPPFADKNDLIHI